MMPAFFRATLFDSVEHLLFFCKSDSIYLFWKWDGCLLLKIYEDGDKSDRFEFAKVTCDASCVYQNSYGEENRIVFEEDCVTGLLRPICWGCRKVVRRRYYIIMIF